MDIKSIITLDYETQGIKGNPVFKPPDPVGLAVWVQGTAPRYLAWGHPVGNNISRGEGLQYARKVILSSRPILFHNGPFDLSVTDGACGTTWRYDDWARIHDTQYLVFLDDPYASTLSLKPSAARYLGLPPDEQDELKAWILTHVPQATEKDWGGYIALAPGDLVGKYAIGDVVRTYKLFEHLYPRIIERGMLAAYEREQRLMPILYQSSRRGIRVDREKLDGDRERYSKELDRADNEIRNVLDAPNLDFGKRGELAEALDHAGFVTEWSLTATGRRSTSKKTLRINDARVDSLIRYRGALNTCLSTFMGPWLELSREDNRLHTSWNQVRTIERDSRGTQTGRLSSNGPNFQNVPTEFDLSIPEGFLALPLMRVYLLPEVGHVWLKRDFSSQEVRILAHFEDGQLLRSYVSDTNFDPHENNRQYILQVTGRDFARKYVKITGFSLIYGAGVPGVMRQTGIDDYGTAKELKDAVLDAMPDVKTLIKQVQNAGRRGEAIRTWGGREYFVEPAKIIEGRLRSFEYKLLNYLIQGSAADQTKQSIIDWDDSRTREAVFLATVHDEINISAPADDWKRHMVTLKDNMDADRFDVPFKSEGFVGPNWEEIEACT
jgi:DNA polymerase I-like protein with 3'-5' exonuclease and polymerase domains